MEPMIRSRYKTYTLTDFLPLYANMKIVNAIHIHNSSHAIKSRFSLIHSI
jgi:hypothetical protein